MTRKITAELGRGPWLPAGRSEWARRLVTPSRSEPAAAGGPGRAASATPDAARRKPGSRRRQARAARRACCEPTGPAPGPAASAVFTVPTKNDQYAPIRTTPLRRPGRRPSESPRRGTRTAGPGPEGGPRAPRATPRTVRIRCATQRRNAPLKAAPLPSVRQA